MSTVTSVETPEGNLGHDASDVPISVEHGETEQSVRMSREELSHLYNKLMDEARGSEHTNPYYMDGPDGDPNYPCMD